MKVWPGQPYPQGATWDGAGVNFALFSENATGVELCLFDSPGAERESARIRLTEQTDLVWHAYLPQLRPGQLYGYRIRSATSPSSGPNGTASTEIRCGDSGAARAVWSAIWLTA
jgi:glycogen operon protein